MQMVPGMLSHCSRRRGNSRGSGGPTLLVALGSAALALEAVTASSVWPRAQQVDTGTLTGQLGATNAAGELVPPASATVYVLFSRGMEGRFPSHANDVDTAGGQFNFQFENLLGKN